MSEQSTLTLKRLSDGKHGVFQSNNQVGTIDHAHLLDYAKQVMDGCAKLSTRLFPGGLKVDQEVRTRTLELMRERGYSHNLALKRVLSSDKGLAERYHAAHTASPSL